MNKYGNYESDTYFGIDQLLLKYSQGQLNDLSKSNIDRIRNVFRVEAEKDVLHFKSLQCKLTIIKWKEEKKSKINGKLIHLKGRIIVRESQVSTTFGSTWSNSDNNEDECSVSSSSDSNEIDLVDLMKDISITLDHKASKTLIETGKIPTLDFE